MLRDDGVVLSVGQVDTTLIGHRYYIHVTAGGSYTNYSIFIQA